MRNLNGTPWLKIPRLNQHFSWIKPKITTLFVSGVLFAHLLAIPVNAAEKLFLSYGPLMLSLRVESLAQFAKDGTINSDLDAYLRLATPEQQKAFREALSKKIPLDPVLVSRFFNTQIGESILMRLGKAITIQGGVNGKYALRAAITGAALSPEGLSLLTVLQQFPTNLQLKGEFIEGFAKAADLVVEATETLTSELRKYTAEEAATDPKVDFAALPDLRQPGSFGVTQKVWQLTDASRDRKFYVDVYTPQTWREGKTPVIVFSHGLASRPEDYDVGLKHLASYGYVVVAPQHPGSDTIYLEEMFQGYHRNIFDVNEFINRPKDISFVLDELQRRNATEFQGRLDLENVGMAGHSFGGYTTLAIAGATIDFENLQRDCDRDYGALDISLLLECRALELPRKDYMFRDKRVTAVFAANPVNRSIFGKQGISKIAIPTFFASGSYDPAAPPALEQAASFTWLTVPDKYWAMVEGQAHVNFTKLDPGISQAISSVGHLTLPTQNVIGNYVDGITVAFFENHITPNKQYRPYLQSSYAEYLSQNQDFKLDVISGASSQKLIDRIQQFRQKHGQLLQNQP